MYRRTSSTSCDLISTGDMAVVRCGGMGESETGCRNLSLKVSAGLFIKGR
jgi:hypothetical protein